LTYTVITLCCKNLNYVCFTAFAKIATAQLSNLRSFGEGDFCPRGDTVRGRTGGFCPGESFCPDTTCKISTKRRRRWPRCDRQVCRPFSPVRYWRHVTQDALTKDAGNVPCEVTTRQTTPWTIAVRTYKNSQRAIYKHQGEWGSKCPRTITPQTKTPPGQNAPKLKRLLDNTNTTIHSNVMSQIK